MVLVDLKTSICGEKHPDKKQGSMGFAGLQRAENHNRVGCLVAQNVACRQQQSDSMWSDNLIFVLVELHPTRCVFTHILNMHGPAVSVCMCVCHLLFFMLNDALTTSH